MFSVHIVMLLVWIMENMMLPSRYWFYVFCLLAAITTGALLFTFHEMRWLYFPAALFFSLSVLGTWDIVQSKQALRRNYPVLAHFRYALESIGPEIRQYFIESDTDELPFSRQQRAIVYQRSKNVIDKRPFGTQMNLYSDDYEWMNHSMMPSEIKSHDFRIHIGANRKKPYNASIFNISAMSFGALSANAIRALNKGAKLGGFYHDTGEGSISQYHREHGGDLVWEIGSGYFGCRNDNGTFNEEKFVANASHDQVKMIEIKLSQGAKPGHGGMLPGAKVSKEIADARGVAQGQDCISPARHSAFASPIELLQFVEKLRTLSGGKPTGFKLAVGHPWEWFAIAKAMIETSITPDFIVVDGGEGGTGAAPLEFTDHVGAPLHEALMLVHNTLVGLNLRQHVRVGAAGKIITAFDIARTLAMGADWCNAARGYMFALGCIQSQSCHTDRCPTGVATQDAGRQRALVPDDKATRVHQFHENTLKAMKELVAAAGLEHPDELGPEHIIRRVSSTQVRSLATLYSFLKPGQLLGDELPAHPVYQVFWRDASPYSFQAPNSARALRGSKLE
jgi:glutamate synthase domain-containing protein 2